MKGECDPENGKKGLLPEKGNPFPDQPRRPGTGRSSYTVHI